MFKLMILFACVILSFGTSDAKPLVKFAPEVEAPIKIVISDCMNQFGQIPDLSNLFASGGYREDEIFQNVLYCSYKNSGYANEDGTIKVKEAAGVFPSEYKIDGVVDKCSKETGKTPVETTLNFFKCFQNNSPVYMDL